MSSILQCTILYSGKPIFHHSPRHIHQYCFNFFFDVLLQFDDSPRMIDAGHTTLVRYPQRKQSQADKSRHLADQWASPFIEIRFAAENSTLLCVRLPSWRRRKVWRSRPRHPNSCARPFSSDLIRLHLLGSRNTSLQKSGSAHHVVDFTLCRYWWSWREFSSVK